MKSFKEMENEFYRAIRQELSLALEQCTDAERRVFKLMYAHGHLDWSIKKVLSQMSRDKFDWAMQQVQRTSEKKH